MRKLLPLFLIICSFALFAAPSAKADTATGTNFEVTKAGAPTTVGTDSTVNFTITIKNISSSTVAPTEVKDTLPEGFVYANDAKLTDLNGSQAAFSPTVSGQVLTWTFDGANVQNIPAGQNIVISFAAASSETAGSYTNQACLTQPENVCATVSITVTDTPSAGLVENVAIGTGVGATLIALGIRAKRKKLSFEDALLRNA